MITYKLTEYFVFTNTVLYSCNNHKNTILCIACFANPANKKYVICTADYTAEISRKENQSDKSELLSH